MHLEGDIYNSVLDWRQMKIRSASNPCWLHLGVICTEMTPIVFCVCVFMCAKCKYASSCRIHVLGILLLLLLGILESNEYFMLQSQLFAVHNLNKSALLSISERNVRMTSTSYMKWYYDRIHWKLVKMRAVFLILWCAPRKPLTDFFLTTKNTH